MSKKEVTVALSGAAGQISYALLFRLAAGEVFGKDTKINLNLLELERALPMAEAVVMELEDCAFPLLNKINVTSDPNVAMKNINWALLIGSVPRKEGMERAELLGINGGIFTIQGKAINANAADDVRIFVVGNPCNTNCLIAMNNAPDVPRDRFFAMTTLDENRAKQQLAIKANVPVADVTNMTVWGNHSATQYPDFYNAKIKAKSATDIITDTVWLQDTFVPMIQQRGAAVIKARGSSSAASAANGVVDGVYNLVHDTPAGDSYSMSRCSQGEYGIDEGLIFSFPCRTDQGKLSVIEGLMHNDFGHAKMKIALEELRSECDSVRKLGLIK